MAMKKYWLSLFLCVTISALAIENLRLPDVRALSMGGNGVTLSSVYNPALLEYSSDKVVRLEYFNRYALKELGTITGSFQLPNRYLSTAFQLTSFGYEQYRQNMVRIELAKRLNSHWSVGVSFQYAWIQSELYEKMPARLSTDIGIVYSPMDKLLIGIMARDLPSVSISQKQLEVKELKSFEIQTGLTYEVIDRLLISAFAAVDESRRIKGGFGLEYVVWERFSLRAGMQTSPFLPCFGAGFRLKGFGIDAVALWHPVLGISSGVGLNYSF